MRSPDSLTHVGPKQRLNVDVRPASTNPLHLSTNRCYIPSRDNTGLPLRPPKLPIRTWSLQASSSVGTEGSSNKGLSDFRPPPRPVYEICALLEYHAASSGSSVPTFRDNLSVPSSRVKKSKKKEYFSLLHYGLFKIHQLRKESAE
jgi:hypothetical protein